MEYKSSFERINGVNDIEYISKNICENYNFAEYVGYEEIKIGYEDFNYVLETTDKKYVVKIFNKDRDEKSCKRLIKILCKAIEEGINHPEIYTNIYGEYIHSLKVQNVDLPPFVMEYIDGKSIYELGIELEENQIAKIAETAAKINNIDFNIEDTFYDEWTITNLVQEYEKKKEYIKEESEQIAAIIERFKQIDWDDLKKSYIHGDLIKANIIRRLDGELYYIDFSAFNYLPRIIECIAIMLGDCLTDTKEDTLYRMKYFLKTYNEYNSLDENELNNLELLLRGLASMYIIQASYIIYTHGDYLENDYWLTQGKKYLAMDISNKDLLESRFNT